MLSSLRLQNFKSWADTGEMRLAPITGLFGTNSSGKTSILQLLLLLKQTVESTDRAQVLDMGDERSLVSLGTFRDIVHGHPPFDSRRSSGDVAIAWSLTWTLPRPLIVADPEDPKIALFSARRLRFESRIEESGKPPNARPVVDRFAYQPHDGERTGGSLSFGMERTTGARDDYRLFADDFDDFELKRPRGRPPAVGYGPSR